MRITNNHGLPDPIIKAVSGRRAPSYGKAISVTRLVDSPLIWWLEVTHWDQIEVDASDMLWALFGQSFHKIMEEHDEDLSETSLSLHMNGWEVRGRLDTFSIEEKTLSDWKVTKAYALVYKSSLPQWEAQLNLYAHMFRHNLGFDIDKIQIYALIRDWDQRKSDQSPDYPRSDFVTVPLRLWEAQEAEDFLVSRLTDFEEAFENGPRPCTDAERWAKPGKTAVMKKGRKSALRLFDTTFEAKQYIVDNKLSSQHYIEDRPGDPYFRCRNYCQVRSVCKQWN